MSESEAQSPQIATGVTGQVELFKKHDVFHGSEIDRMLKEQTGKGWKTSALLSDFDNSYFNPISIADTQRIAEVAKEFNIPTIIVTGNDKEGLIRKMAENGIRMPEVIISAAGTEVWFLETDSNGVQIYAKDEEYDRKISGAGVNRLHTVETAKKLIQTWQEDPQLKSAQLAFQHPEVESAFAKGEPADIQPHKVSFYFFGDSSIRAHVQEEMKRKFPHLEVLICEEIGHNATIATDDPKKYCIDLLPKPVGITHGGKAGATEYIQNELGIRRSLKVGDSGNDIGMLRDGGVGEGVIVGNAKPELSEQLLTDATPLRESGFVKVVDGEGNKHRYIQMNDGTESAGSIRGALVRRLKLTLQFEGNPEFRETLKKMIEALES